MKFENAYEGVKKIYTAEILAIVAAACGIIAAIVGVVSLASRSAGGLLGTGFFGIAAAVLFVVSYIMNIVGINRASKDEAAFKNALYVVLAGIVVSIVGSFFKEGTFMNGLFSTLNTVCNFLVTFLVCQGIINLAEKLEDAAVAEKGKKVQKLMLIVWIIAIVVKLISAILGGGAAAVVGGILGIVGSVISIVAFVLYLGLLGKGKRMLA